MKRREFLKSVAFTGAAGLILPHTKLFGAASPNNKLTSPATKGTRRADLRNMRGSHGGEVDAAHRDREDATAGGARELPAVSSCAERAPPRPRSPFASGVPPPRLHFEMRLVFSHG